MVVLDFSDERCSFIFKNNLYVIAVKDEAASVQRYMHPQNVWITMPLNCEAGHAIKRWFNDNYPENS